MRALGVFPSQKTFRLVDHPEPALASPADVKFRILDVGICGTDKEILAFDYGEPPAGSDYLVIGHEALAEVVEVGPEVSKLKPGDLCVPTVRRPCDDPSCVACRAGRQDFCYTGKFTERGIKQRHGYMTELVVEDVRYVNPVPASLREVGVLVEPLTIAEKAVTQMWQVQQRLPWACPVEPGKPAAYCHKALVLGAGPVGLLGAMKLVLEGFETFVYSRSPEGDNRADIVSAIGATFLAAEQMNLDQVAERIGNIDLVYEAVGASQLAFDVLKYLGTNGVFIFTGVPGRKSPSPVDTDRLMRDYVLKNQVAFGTVNASPENFQDSIRDLELFYQRWPDAVRAIITQRLPLEQAEVPLAGKTGGIKNVISVSK